MDELAQTVWGCELVYVKSALKMSVSRLRRKAHDSKDNPHILARKGIGYEFRGFVNIDPPETN